MIGELNSKKLLSKIETRDDLIRLFYLSQAFQYGCDFLKSPSGDLYTTLTYVGFQEESDDLQLALKDLRNESCDINDFTILGIGDLGLEGMNEFSPLILDEGELLPEFLYHYTNGQGLLGILDKKKLWATQHNFLNDKSEMYYAIKLFKRCLKEKVEKFDVDNYRYKALSNLSWQVGDFVHLNHVFVSSFSENGDLLSQWRGYGNNGYGFSLGFNPKMINLTSDKKVRDFFLTKVIYDKLTQEKIIEDILDDFIEELDKIGENIEYGSDEYHRLSNSLVFNMVRFKDKAFREEAEWRIISFSGAHSFNDGFKDLNVRAGLSVGVNNLVIYKEIDFMPELQGLICESPIREIIIGPQNDTKKSKMALEIVLNKHFKNSTFIDIRESESSSYTA